MMELSKLDQFLSHLYSHFRPRSLCSSHLYSPPQFSESSRFETGPCYPFYSRDWRFVLLIDLKSIRGGLVVWDAVSLKYLRA